VDYSKEIDDLRAYWHDEYQVGTIAFSPPLVAKVTVRGEALDALIVLEHGLRPEVEQEQGDLETTAEVGESPVVANVDQAVPGTSCDSQILALDSAGKVFRFNLEEAKIWDAIVPGVGNFDKLIYLYDQWFQHRGNFLMPPELAGTDSPNYARYRTREQARDWFLAHDKVLHPDAASLKSQDQVDAVNNLAASRLPAELADLAVADAPTATAPTVSQSVATELNQIPDEVADREIRRTQPNGKTDSSTWQEQEQGLGEDQRPEFPTCEFCLIPPNRLRWQGEVTVEPRLWRLLGMAIRSMGTAIPFESIQEQIHADKPVNDKTIRNEIYELNKHLLDIAFPWGVAPKHSHLVRKPDGP
jgi:hypothetical protein